jgi:hypothetical protein
MPGYSVEYPKNSKKNYTHSIQHVYVSKIENNTTKQAYQSHIDSWDQMDHLPILF